MIVTSLKTDGEIAHEATTWIISNGATLEQFRLLFFRVGFPDLLQETRSSVTLCVVAIPWS